MNWREIQKEWEAGNHEIAIRLLKSMIFELRFKQKRLFDFGGEKRGQSKIWTKNLKFGCSR